MAENEPTISMAGINAPPLYRLVEDGDKTVIMTADTNTPMWVINGKIGGDTVETMTTAERTAITPEAGQLIYDTDEGALYVGDGETAGGIPVGSGGGGGGGTPATVTDIMTGSGASKILNVQNIRGALTAGQAVDVTSEPDNFSTYAMTGTYKGTFWWNSESTLGFASFPKFASGLKYLLIADVQAMDNGATVTPGGTWLSGGSSAISLPNGVYTRIAMLFDSDSACVLTFSGTDPAIKNLREYEVTACSNEAIAYIAALSNPDAFADYYLVKADMVQPWTKIIDMGESPATTVAAGLAYQIKALTGSHIITTDTCPDGYIGRDAWARIFIGDTGNVVVQSPLVLATPLVANAINNCIIQYRDGEAVLSVTDTLGGYIISLASGTTDGSLYYGLTTNDDEHAFISIPSSFDGIPVDLGGASVSAQKFVVGAGTNTLVSGTVNAGAGKLGLNNLALSDVGITGGTLTIPNSVIVGNVNVSSGASCVLSGCSIESGGRVAYAGGVITLANVYGGTVSVTSGGSRISIPVVGGTTVTASGVAFDGDPVNSGEILYVSNAVLRCDDCTFQNNATKRGAVFVIHQNTSAFFNSCMFSSCTGSGAAFVDTFTLTDFVSCTFVSPANTSQTGVRAQFYGSQHGEVRLDGCEFTSAAVLVSSGASCIIKGSNTIYQVRGPNGAQIYISAGASVTLNNHISATSGVTVLDGGCVVNGLPISAGTYTAITSSGGSAVVS